MLVVLHVEKSRLHSQSTQRFSVYFKLNLKFYFHFEQISNLTVVLVRSLTQLNDCKRNESATNFLTFDDVLSVPM